jgi:hypothetical protein
MMTQTLALMMALTFAAPVAAMAATPQGNQPNSSFSQGKTAPVLSDGAATGYNNSTAG